MIKTITYFSLLLPLMLTVSACGNNESEQTQEHQLPPGTPVTVQLAEQRDLDIVLEAIGQAVSKSAPTVAAEVDGRIQTIIKDEGMLVESGEILAKLDTTELQLLRNAAFATTNSLQAQLSKQENLVKRYRKLKKENHVSRTLLDEAEFHFVELKQNLSAAKARLHITEDKLTKATFKSPVSGKIEKRFVFVGDYVKKGDPLFLIAATDQLRIKLVLPETASEMLKPGQDVNFISALDPTKQMHATLTELQPMVGANNKAIIAIVDVEETGILKPNTSISAQIVIERHPAAVVVPEQSVVRRPAGNVVYVIKDNNAVQRVVKTGLRKSGIVEILEGLTTGETIAVDGAAFLTNNTPVNIKQGE